MDEPDKTKTSRKRPYVKVSYWIHGNDEPDNSFIFDASNVVEARIGLPLGRTAEKVSRVAKAVFSMNGVENYFFLSLLFKPEQR